MFGFLKKKIDEFASKLSKKAEEKIESAAPVEAPVAAPTIEPVATEAVPEPTIPEPQPEEPEPVEEKPEPVVTEPAEQKPVPVEPKPVLPKPAPVVVMPVPVEAKPIPKPVPTPEARPIPKAELPKPVPKPVPVIVKPVEPKPAEAKPVPKPAPKIGLPTPLPKPATAHPVFETGLENIAEALPAEVEIKPPAPAPVPEKKPAFSLTKLLGIGKKEEPKPSPVPEKKEKLGLVKQLKRAVGAEVSLSPAELDSFMWEFELALLEADVAQPVAEELITKLKAKLASTKFSKDKDIKAEIEKAVRETILDIVNIEGFDIVQRVKKGSKPFVILFLGPNGAGKTTTIGKVCRLLQKNKLSVIFAASDTFRAASIEQLQHHADALGVRVIKHDYGADPAAVAFDAVAAAKAGNIDCVLIDTAGRQETNRNLMEELKKIKRVAAPALTIYLDEALAGNVLIERVAEFKGAVGVDGVILSKMDMDVKGGGTISIARSTGVPIIYYGTGQSYDDLVPFDAKALLERVLG